MKIINKLCYMLIVTFMIASSCVVAYANDFNSNHITLANDEKATVEKKYPVIIATNNTDRALRVTYDFYYDEQETKEMNKELVIPANQSVVIEIPELSILGKTGKSRRVWFSWSEKSEMKPLMNQIETHPFKNEDKPSLELG